MLFPSWGEKPVSRVLTSELKLKGNKKIGVEEKHPDVS
jgi:hypothetical protein